MSRTRVIFLTTGLELGGAELMLFRLVARLSERFQPTVVSLIAPGIVGHTMTAAGIDVRTLGMRRGTPDPLSFARLVRMLRRERPAVMQTWMYHADLLGGLASRLAGGIPVTWGVRHSDPAAEGYGATTHVTAKACARLSHQLPTRIVCCSDASLVAHVRAGYDASRMLMIPNGVDATAFKPDRNARTRMRETLGVPAHAVLIGMVGRFHPQKDHAGFVRAASRLTASHPAAYFMLCGNDVDWDNADLSGWIDAAGLRERFRLLGPRQDVSDLMVACDLATSSSRFGESFSNVISEAMSCGVACVVTDVGDSGAIVGDTGIVVVPNDAAALAAAWAAMLADGPDALATRGAAARRRVEREFGMDAIVRRYEALYDLVATRAGTA